MKLEPLGDSAVVATLGTRIDAATLASVLKFAGAVAAAQGKGIVDIVPAYATVTVFYDPAQFAEPGEDAYEVVRRFIESCAMRGGKGAHPPTRKLVEVPVCYGGDLGPDLEFVAGHAGIGIPEVIARHSAADYLVHAIGFTPGFPFLGGLPDSLRTPRRETPRARVPAGSVGIGGYQTGVYPITSPGGWQIIGRTPLTLFRPDRTPAALLHPGDRLRFKAISAEEFESWT
jgi:inhibitor of KinA